MIQSAQPFGHYPSTHLDKVPGARMRYFSKDHPFFLKICMVADFFVHIHVRVYYSTCNALCARKIDRICVSVGSCCLLQASMFLMMSFSFQNLRYCQNESDSHVPGHGHLGCACVRWAVATRGWISVRWIACSGRGSSCVSCRVRRVRRSRSWRRSPRTVGSLATSSWSPLSVMARARTMGISGGIVDGGIMLVPNQKN